MNTKMEIRKIEQQLELIKTYGDLSPIYNGKIRAMIEELEEMRLYINEDLD